MKTLCIASVMGVLAAPAFADTPVIKAVSASHSGDIWRFSVTLQHDDEGWDHYADGWSVLAENGELLGHRVLAHPHVDEQPFTRSLGGIEIPSDVTKVLIRPHDKIHGDGPDFVFELN